jgi:uncharacterized membrane protein
LNPVKVKDEKNMWQIINIALPIFIIALFGGIYQAIRNQKYGHSSDKSGKFDVAGFCLGLFLGLIGLLIGYLISRRDKERDLMRAVLMGLVCNIVLSVLVSLLFLS